MKWILYFTLIVSSSVFANEKINSINFLQEGDVSKLIIKLSGNTLLEKKEIKDDKMILLDVKNVTASKRVLRAIDTSEFKSSVTYISGYQSPTNKSDIRFAINLRDNVRSKLEQNKDRVVLVIENRFGVFDKMETKDNKSKVGDKTFDQNGVELNMDNLNIPKSNSITDIIENLTQAGPKKYIGKKISLNVREMPVVELLQILSEVSGFNIIVGRDVKGAAPLTLNLAEVPWDEALDTVLKLSKLVAEKHSNILVVDTLANATLQKEREIKEKALSQKQEPLVTKVFPISYAKLDDLITILKDYSTEGRGKITKDARTNNVIVQDTLETIERMKRIVELLDAQTPQVLIEAKIVETTEKFGKKIGLGTTPTGSGLNVGYGNDNGSFTINSAPSENASLFGAGFTGSMSGISLTSLNFNLELSEFNSETKIISSPRVITENNKTAKIAATDTKNVLVQNTAASGAGTTAAGPTAADVETIDASLTLDVTPNITNDGSIALDVKINKTGFENAASSENLNTNTRLIETSVLVDNGATVVLGGLYLTNSTISETGIPILKDLPILGWLFKTAYNPSTEKKELIVFITPRIINQEEAGLTSRLQQVEKGDSVTE